MEKAMAGYTAGFSGLMSTGEGGTLEIVNRIPGAEHYASLSGTADWKEVAQEITGLHSSKKMKRPLCIFGHSNGGYSVLKIAQTLDAQGIEIDYLGVIDLTLKPSPPVYGNVKLFQEFHSAYAKTKLHASFTGKHEYFELDDIMDDNIGHSEAIRLDFTQNKIVETIAMLTRGEAVLPVELNKMVIEAGKAIDPANETPEQTKFNRVFFNTIRPQFGSISPGAIDGMKMIIHAFDTYIAPKGYGDELLAFVLGNVFNETGKRMVPVRETNAKTHAGAMAALDKWWASGRAKMAGVKSRYWKDGFYGRGLFQETHYGNYSKGSVLWEKWFAFPLDFTKNPDLFLNPIVSALSAFIGSIEGKYTCRKFSDYCKDGVCDFAEARRMVNGDRKLVLRDVDGDGILETMGDEIGQVCEAFLSAISKAREAISNHPARVDPEQSKPPVVDSDAGLDTVRYLLSAHLPNLTNENADLILGIALVLGRMDFEPPPKSSPPDFRKSLHPILLPNPSIEAGFSLSNPKPQPKESIMAQFDGNKTYIALAIVAAVAFMEGYAGIDIPGVQLQDNWLETVLGTGVFGGFAHKIQKLFAAITGK